jgi:acyl-coenzyme A thioesterase PaaI-like protein
MTDSSNKLPRDVNCFVCGTENPIGLKLKFKKISAGVVEATFIPCSHFNGFKGIFHGGVISSVLDDAMAWAIYAGTGKWYVTAKMTIEFKEAAPVEEQLTVKGYMAKEDGIPYCRTAGEKIRRIQYAKAELLNSNGDVLACSQGKFFQIPDDKLKELWTEA